MQNDSIETASPYKGYYEEVTKKSTSSILSMIRMLKRVPDFDARKCKPQAGEEYFQRKAEDRDALTFYEKDLNKIHPSWVTHYIENMMYSVRFNDNGEEYLAKRNFVEQNVMVDAEDSDSVKEELEMQLDFNVDDLSVKQLIDYRKRAIYLVKTLSRLGARHGVHMMSLICAHEKAKYLRATGKSGSINKNGGKAKPSEILAHKVYHCSFNGDLVELSPGEYAIWDNKDEYTNWAHPFITGDYDSADAESYKNYTDLLKLCYELDIDLKDEDPTKYTREVLDELAVVYVKGNKDYLSNKVIKAIKESPMFMQEVALTVDPNIKESPVNSTKYTALKFRDMMNLAGYYKLNSEERINSSLLKLLYFYKYNLGLSDVSVDLDSYRYFEGFLANDDGTILTLPATPLLSKKMLGVQSKHKMVVHKSGILVLVSSGATIRYTVPSLYTQYIDDFIYYSEVLDYSKQLALTGAKNIIRSMESKQYVPGNFGYGHWYSQGGV